MDNRLLRAKWLAFTAKTMIWLGEIFKSVAGILSPNANRKRKPLCKTIEFLMQIFTRPILLAITIYFLLQVIFHVAGSAYWALLCFFFSIRNEVGLEISEARRIEEPKIVLSTVSRTLISWLALTICTLLVLLVLMPGRESAVIVAAVWLCFDVYIDIRKLMLIFNLKSSLVRLTLTLWVCLQALVIYLLCNHIGMPRLHSKITLILVFTILQFIFWPLYLGNDRIAEGIFTRLRKRLRIGEK